MAKRKKIDKVQQASESWTENLEGATTEEEKKPKHLHYHEIGATGLIRYRDQVADEWHTKLRGRKAMKIYREMSDNDAVCGSLTWLYEALLRGVDRTIQASGKQPEEIYYRDKVESMFDDMSHTWQEFLSDALSMSWAGYSFHEVVLKVRRGHDQPAMFRSKWNDGVIAWRKWAIRGQQASDGWEFDDDGGINAHFQRAAPKWIRTRIPIEQSLLFRTKSNRNNPEGRSLFRNAYRSWWYLKRIQELEAIGVEKDMAGLLVMQLPESYFADDADSDALETIENYRQLVERSRRGEYDGMVIPPEEDKEGKTGWKLSLLQSGGRRPMDTNEIIKRLESRIAVSLLGESVLLGMQGNVGSWSLASSKTHTLALGLRAIRDSITDVINRFAIPRIMEANHWPMDAAPTLELGDIETDDANDLMNSLGTAVGAGLLTPGPMLESYLRARVGVPEEEPFEPENPAVQTALENQDTIDEANKEGFEDDLSEEALRNVVPITGNDKPVGAFMDIQEASDYLGVSATVIRSAVDRGQIPGNRVGRGVRLHRSALDDYMLNRQRAA